MTILSVSDAARMAGVSFDVLNDQIDRGTISRTPDGVDVSELIRVYPNLQPLAGLKIREVKNPRNLRSTNNAAAQPDGSSSVDITVLDIGEPDTPSSKQAKQPHSEAATVKLLVRELEWNKELLEQTNQLMAKQLADQRALIADQARRLDEKDRFWARQVEIAQSLLAAPAPAPRKKFLGIF